MTSVLCPVSNFRWFNNYWYSLSRTQVLFFASNYYYYVSLTSYIPPNYHISTLFNSFPITNPHHSITNPSLIVIYGELVIYWWFIGDILVIYWRYIGDILAIYWRYIGDILAIYWRYIGDILTIYWRYIGDILAIYWRFIGDLSMIY
jgi:hypothetical protein